jgi:hypothetical protein
LRYPKTNMFRKDTLLRPNAWLSLIGSAVAAISCYTPFLYLKSFDIKSLLYLAVLLLITLAFGFYVILRGIISKKWVKPGTWIALVVVLGVTFAMSCSATRLRPWARWLIFSNTYKSQVLAQTITSQNDLRFVQWDGWGWAGMETNVYLIYDPSDKLKVRTNRVPGKKSVEITEKSQFIQRLEHNWYSATLYTDEYLASEA